MKNNKKGIIIGGVVLVALIAIFAVVGTTASAANYDKVAKRICAKYTKAAKAGSFVGKVKVTYKKQKGAYNFTFTLNMDQDDSTFAMLKLMGGNYYNETRDSFKSTTTKLRKDIKKQGIKKVNVTYIVKAKGKKLWVAKNGKITYDKYK
ncbi:hypothetical protein [Butyrivibrio sp. AE3006]|uniref:hypothetical protein n=1 Tax=Butyrivibrio sp. AE3006 TaxID=1280673 RepID=UPI000410F060|nr:hypothetical protein [Butyrivibrio sp. AE3006]